jgi:hypothetical protein
VEVIVGARAAVFSLLTTDLVLGAEPYSIGPDHVWPNGALDVSPRDGYFLCLRWEEQTLDFGSIGAETLTVWAHVPREISTDYVPLARILGRVRDILLDAEHVAGEDGVLSCAKFNGMSGDFNDSILKTITKNAAFSVVANRSTVE